MERASRVESVSDALVSRRASLSRECFESDDCAVKRAPVKRGFFPAVANHRSFGRSRGGSRERAAPQNHSRGRDDALAGPESSRDARGRSWGRVWISTRGSPRYARVPVPRLRVDARRRQTPRPLRASFLLDAWRICEDPEEAPRARLPTRVRAVARRRRASAHRRYSRTSSVDARR